MKKITFDPKAVVKKLFSSLEERPRNILQERFGLGAGDPRTLESIGQEYGITRERVRQVEAFALGKLRQSDEYKGVKEHFDELGAIIDEFGGLVHEKEFLLRSAKNDKHQRHVHFLLVLGNDFRKIKESKDFHSSWAIDESRVKKLHGVFEKLHKKIDGDELISESEIVDIFSNYFKALMREKVSQNKVLDLLKISRAVAPNALGEWGKASSPSVRPRGMKDYAFLVMRNHGSPMHFSETAKAIEDIFDKPAHMQTVHNEVIKDPRFVLVGRGLYALSDWGYKEGVVRNVIEKILEEEGPLTKEEIVKKVLKERYVKENTILVNLQNGKHFKKNSKGKYISA